LIGVIAAIVGSAAAVITIPELHDAVFGSARFVVSREFMVGKWQVEQSDGNVAIGTTLVYRPNGTLEGQWERFDGAHGKREPWSGTWEFDKMSDKEFRLRAIINGQTFDAMFLALDRDRIQNETANYLAVRVP
jgi:hypothetical protein